MERKRFIPLVALGLAVAEISAGCSTRSEKMDKQAQEMLDHNKQTTFIVDANDDVIKNGGLNVRQFPGNVYADQETNAITVIGKIRAGTVIMRAVKFNDKWAAADCSDVFNDTNKKGEVCYINYRNNTREVEITPKE
jgi:hypothetical protein